MRTALACRVRPDAVPCGSRWLVGATGFEPATARPPAECATRLRHAPKRATGIEPALEAWKASVQAQHFARVVDSLGRTGELLGHPRADRLQGGLRPQHHLQLDDQPALVECELVDA